MNGEKSPVAQPETPSGELAWVNRVLQPSNQRNSSLLRGVRNGLQKLQAFVIHAKRRRYSRKCETGADMAKAVARSKKAPVRRPWSKDDVRLLKRMARKEPAAKIAKALKRTESATRQKATGAGISLSMTRKKRAPTKKR
jgi:hypothetical protein